MNDAHVLDLARRAGIAVEWSDYAGKPHQVGLEAVRSILGALGLSCDTPAALAHSRQILEQPALPPLIAATAGQPIDLPILPPDAPPRVRVTQEDGRTIELSVRQSARGAQVPAIEPAGYHTMEIGEASVTLAVAPKRCITVSDIVPGERVWGLAVQLYGLRSRGDCGIGDMAGVTAFAKTAAALKCDGVALSPVHALFAADPTHFSPYSPSNRLFYNPLHADASAIFGEARVAKARSDAQVETVDLEASALIDWPRCSRRKMSLFRQLFDVFCATDLLAVVPTALAADFASFRAASGLSLAEHALFEALHAARLQDDPQAWSWRDWSAAWRDPHRSEVKDFAEKNRRNILFHVFLQWIADRSLAATRRQVAEAGMRIGLISDLAVGMNSSGSHAWSNQQDILGGLQIGAPPDLFNTGGQNWGLTTFSPRALARGGFAPFIATLGACMRHAGGVRIDHAMGLMRLWVIPHGASAVDGAYLTYPLDDLLQLTALESHRHRAIVIGEDLGTVPPGFPERLKAAGIYGMSVLWFERKGAGFAPARSWPADVAAMTSTHDLPTVAGWWSGRDIEVRSQCGFIKNAEHEEAARIKDRKALWKALREGKAGEGELPAPAEGEKIATAAVKFIARTPARLALLPLEDASALEDQPNLPATIDEQPNWRRRYPGTAAGLLDPPAVRNRLHPLMGRKALGRKE
jgi:4-alpha-glucanotransferase